jgi:hypothetical protein
VGAYRKAPNDDHTHRGRRPPVLHGVSDSRVSEARNDEEERGTQCVTLCLLLLLEAAVARVFVQAEACSVIRAQKLKWTDF